MGKWINCKNCGQHYHTDLARCPQCGKYTVCFREISAIVVVSAVCIFAVIGIILGALDNAPKGTDVASEVVDSEELYSQFEDKKDNSSDDTSSADTSSQQTSSKTDSSKVTTSSEKSSSNISSKAESEDTLSITEDPFLEYFSTKDTDGAVLYTNQTVHITYPDYMVYIAFEDGEVTLSSEMRDKGFTSVTRNSNGSATFTIPPKDYLSYCEYLEGSVLNYFKTLVEKSDTVTGFKNQSFNTIEFTLSYEEPIEEDEIVAVLLGCLINQLQLIHQDFSLGCDIKFYYKGNSQPVVYSFPSVFKEAYELSKQ